MGNCLTLDVQKIYTKHRLSNNRDDGIMIDSNICGMSYIVKGNSVIMASIQNGVFAIDMARITKLLKELSGIGEMYGNDD